jgi:hypothetical protein
MESLAAEAQRSMASRLFPGRSDFMTNETVTIKLSASEALVLYEFLSRFSDDEVLKIEDQAEERVLWNVCASLESRLTEPMAQDYGAVLAKARAEVRDENS